MLFPRPKMEALCLKTMSKALTYSTFRDAGLQLDRLQGKDAWKLEPRSALYDHRFLTARYLQLRQVDQAGSTPEALFFLRSGALRNLGGYCESALLERCHSGTKTLIESYVGETVKLVQTVAAATDVDPRVTYDFLVELLQGYGRTVLVLHGGASFGACHLGVAKALHDQGLLPRIACGSYIGALVASFICVQPPEGLSDALSGRDIDLSAFNPPGSSVRRRLTRLLKYGHLFSVAALEAAARSTLGDITFREAFHRSQGMILNISIRSERQSEVPVLLNYLTAPDVLVWSAACASCAVPGLFEEAVLMMKTPGGQVMRWNPSGIRLESAKVVEYAGRRHVGVSCAV